MSVWGTRLSYDGTWPDEPPPIRYQGSARVPRDTDPRGGLFEIAAISSELTADGKDDGPADGPPLPFLRLSAAERVVIPEDAQPGELVGTAPGMQTVILDATQVRELRDALTGWFHAPEQDGRRSWACPHCDGTGECPECQTSEPPPGGSQVAHTRAEVEAALTHGPWCNRVLHPEQEDCDCAVRDLVGQLIARGWLVLVEEGRA